MQTVQIEFDETLLAQVDETTKTLKKNRAELIQDAVRDFLENQKIKQMEERHREGYERFPVQPDEFYVDEEQLIEAWKDL